MEDILLDKTDHPFGQTWRQIGFKSQPALGSLPANRCDVFGMVRSGHWLWILLLHRLQDSQLAILPEMFVKRDCFLDVQPFHDGEAHRVAIAERFVLILLD